MAQFRVGHNSTMRYPTRTEFRWLAVCGLVLVFTGRLMQVFASLDESELPDYLGGSSPHLALIIVGTAAGLASLIGCIGFLLFEAWSRWWILSAWCVRIAVRPFEGIEVLPAWADALAALGSFLFIVPFVLSFFPPCSGYFIRHHAQREVVQSDLDDAPPT
jgi:hypothetical protein